MTVVVLASCTVSKEDFKKTLARGRVNSSEISMTMSIEEIELKYGKPEIEQTILDWGCYGYKEFAIFFKDKFTIVNGTEIKKTNKEENAIFCIRWFQNISIFGLIIDFTSGDDVATILGQPDKQYTITPGDKYGSFFAGKKMKYISGKYALIVSIDEKNKVTDIILGHNDLEL
ncbi:MAG: hypothetical protein JW874_14305 [Spirochaetales bacterium]|nr:hypothetical protein [Spirochaetales bacterium]